jgi:hypothetical protein
MRKLIASACIFSLLVSAVVVAGCALEDRGPRTVKEVAAEFLDELASGDTSAAWDMLSAQSQKLLRSEPEFDALVSRTLPDGEALASAQVVKTSAKGDAASATYTTVVDGKKRTDDLKLIKEDGAWKISLGPDEK